MSEQRERIGFIGVGVMGRPMCLNLLAKGFPLTIYARRPSTVESVLEAGATLAESPRMVAEQSDIVITCVSNSPDVVKVVLGPNGVLEGTHPGLVVIDMSTIAPSVSRQVAQAAAERAVAFMDAPVSGGSQGAQAGTLTIMAAGERAVFDRCRPVFAAMGKHENIFYVGSHGAGSVVKIVNQILCGVIAAANAEAFVLGVKAGADVETMARIIGVSSGANWQLTYPFMLRGFNGSFEPGFMTDLLHKDLGLALDLAAESQSPLPLTALARQLYEMTRAEGYGQRDYTALLAVLERMAGVTVRIPAAE